LRAQIRAVAGAFRDVRVVCPNLLNFDHNDCPLAKTDLKVEPSGLVRMSGGHPDLPANFWSQVIPAGQIIRWVDSENLENAARTLQLLKDPMQPIRIGFFTFASQSTVDAQVKVERIFERVLLLPGFRQQPAQVPGIEDKLVASRRDQPVRGLPGRRWPSSASDQLRTEYCPGAKQVRFVHSRHSTGILN
jgi:hypothetical protein